MAIKSRDLGLVPRGGKSRQYTVVSTGEVISRRQADKLVAQANEHFGKEIGVPDSYVPEFQQSEYEGDIPRNIFDQYYASWGGESRGSEYEASKGLDWITLEYALSREEPSKGGKDYKEWNREVARALQNLIDEYGMDLDSDDWDSLFGS